MNTDPILFTPDVQVYNPLELLCFNLSAGRYIRPADNHLWQELNELLNWENIILKGYQSDLCPLFHYIIEKQLPEKTFYEKLEFIKSSQVTTKQIKKTVKTFYYYNLSRNMRIFQALDKILEILNTEKIPVILLKGVDIAQTCYPDIALRPMSDIDILVDKCDIQLAEAMIQDLGFSKKKADSHSRHSFHTSYVKTDEYLQLTVEIHWDLVNPIFFSRIDLPLMWSQAEIHSRGKNTFMTFCAEDSFLYLCWHGCRHGYSRLIWIYDIALLIKNNNNIDIEKLYNYSKKIKFGNYLKFSMVLILKLLGDDTISTKKINRININKLNKIESIFVKIHKSKLKNKSIKKYINLLSIQLFDTIHIKINHIVTRIFLKIKIPLNR